MISLFGWWVAVTLIGIIFMPVSSLFFGMFKDKGWIFSKVLGIFVTGYLVWLLAMAKILKFSAVTCYIVACVCLVANMILWRRQKKEGHDCFREISLKTILIDEIVFLILFLVWSYLIGYAPQAFGTEKFMDYGFMTSMMRDDYMPGSDMWHSGDPFNYYYGGQYYATFLTKLSGVYVGKGYNLMRAMIGAFAFAMPFALVREMMTHTMMYMQKRKRQGIALISGLVAGAAVSLAGNMHFVIYGKIIPTIQQMLGIESEYKYWWPDSTRFIGYNPDVEDKTIHEFPCYSTVLGDLHAHFVNILFIMLVIALAYAWARKWQQRKDDGKVELGLKTNLKGALLDPHVILIGLMTGIFRFINYWDFPIYFVVAGSVIVFMNIRLYGKELKTYLTLTILQAVEVFVLGYIASLPFILSFHKISSEILFVHSHSPMYQLAVLWGLPTVAVVGFICFAVQMYKKGRKEEDQQRKEENKKKGNLFTFINQLSPTDLTVIILGLCAIGLLIMPEVIYMKDIYTSSHYRANTMFKLTYQAFMLFGICMGYIFFRVQCAGWQRHQYTEAPEFTPTWGKRIFCVAGIILLLCTFGYFFNAIGEQFGDYFDLSRRKSLDASSYLEDATFATDQEACRWIEENVKGSPMILEATEPNGGGSYTAFSRVSVTTGLPTVLGWYTHEWLWRDDQEDRDERVADVKTMYTSTNEEEIRSLFVKYDITYVYIGAKEQLMIDEMNGIKDNNGNDTESTVAEEDRVTLNTDTLLSMGDVVFEQSYSDGSVTYIVKVQ